VKRDSRLGCLPLQRFAVDARRQRTITDRSASTLLRFVVPSDSARNRGRSYWLGPPPCRGVSGCRPAAPFRLPDATSCASTNRCSVWSVTTHLRVLRTVRASPARSCSPRGGSARQAFPGASPEVSVPFSASGPRRAARSCRSPDDPAPAFVTLSAARPVGSAAVGGHRPCGLTLTSTPGFNPASRTPVRLGSCTVGLSGRGVPLPSRTNSRLGREVYPGSAHGVPALRSVAPARG